MAKRFRRIAMATAGVAVAAGLALPAAAAQAATGYTPSSSEWWMANWNVPQQVWPLTQGSGVTVGVVDSGVQASLPDLSGVVLPGGDVLGYGSNGEKDFESSQDGHGTGVAALIAGQGTGGGPVGIAPKARILPVHTIDPATTANSSAVPDGIKYAVDHGAKVINVSIAASASPTPTSCGSGIQNAVAYAVSHDVVVVSGSGDTNKNGPGPIEPASCPGVLAVGGIEPTGALWQNSTQQPYVSVAAPGDHIFVLGMDGRTDTAGDGTSYASPLVAGVAALIRSKYPSMPWYQVDQRIIGTAIPVKPIPNDGYGYGITDVAKAVNASSYPVSSSTPNPPYTRYLAWLKSPNGQIWAQQNGVSAPSGSNAAPSKSGSGSAAPIAIGVVIVLLLAGAALALALRSRRQR